ncbi:MAG: hypothetical protein QXV73_03285, partial [Candidatus Micrarchaeia archaeon]
EHLASLIAQLEMKEKEEREKEKETSDTDLKERIEEKEEIKEKEHEKFIEEIENKEREKEEIRERIEEEAARIIEKNLDEEEVIKERLEAEILAVQESRLLELAETVKEYSQKERLEELKEYIEETKEEIKERVEILDKIEERIENAEKDGKGAEGLLNDIEQISKEISKIDKETFQKEIEKLLKEIEELEKTNPDAAVRKAKEFIKKHSAEREIFREINNILIEWDHLSRDEIKKRVNQLHENILNTAKSLLEAARKIEMIDEKIEELNKAVIKKIEESLQEKEGKRIIKKGEIIDVLNSVWINSVVTFINSQILKAKQAKKENKERYWKNALERTSQFKEIDRFDKELRKNLTKDDYLSAVKFAKHAVSSYLREIARTLQREIYAIKLKDVVEADKKENMKKILENIFQRLKILDEKIKILINLAENNNIEGIMDVLKTFDKSDGSFRKILMRVMARNRSKAKREFIKQLLKELEAINMPLNAVKRIIEAYDKKDYKTIDELCDQIITYVNLLDKRYSKFLELRRMKNGKKKNAKSQIARIFASDIYVISKYMSIDLRKYHSPIVSRM